MYVVSVARDEIRTSSPSMTLFSQVVLLRNEGVSEPLIPFFFLSVLKSVLTSGPRHLPHRSLVLILIYGFAIRPCSSHTQKPSLRPKSPLSPTSTSSTIHLRITRSTHPLGMPNSILCLIARFILPTYSRLTGPGEVRNSST